MGKKIQNPILVTQSSMPDKEDFLAEISSIWDTKWLTNNGAIHEKFNQQLRDFFKSPNVTLFVNGHLALDVAIKALHLTGEVITTPFTFVSTTHAIVMNNLTPVFCDIKLNDYTIDEEQIEKLITNKTSAILAVHVYGNPCNVTRLEAIAQKHNLKLIFDAAHVFGVKVNDRPISDYGDVSMFSFHATKVFHSIEGGALVYKYAGMKKELDNLKNFGIASAEDIVAVGLNAKMNEFQAAMGICNLKKFDDGVIKRKAVVERYYEKLADVAGIRIFKYPDNMTPVYSYFPILVDEKIYGATRNELHEELLRHNIVSRKYFYPLTSDCQCYKERYSFHDIPVARYVADRILTIPLYADLALENVDIICDIITKFRKNH